MRRVLLTVMLLLVSSPFAQGQAGQGAVILMGESGAEPDLVADLGEVLVTALLQKSNNRYRFLGKEGVVTELQKRRTQSGQVCIESNDCLRAYAKEAGLQLMVYGKVGKAAYGYWLIITKIGLTGIPDEIKKIKVEGGVTGLIENVEASADWLLGPDRTWLQVTVDQEGAVLSLDDKEIGPVAAGPMEVPPGKHKVVLRKKGYADYVGEVDCEQGTLCKVEAAMAVATAETKPYKPPVKEPPKPRKSKSRTWQTLGWVFSSLSVASLGTAIYFSLMLNDDVQRYDDRLKQICPGNVCNMTKETFDADSTINSIMDDGESHALWANVTWIGAGVTGAAAVTFFLVDAFADTSKKQTYLPRLQPVVVPGFAGLTFNLDF